jgi:hypothetical protein
MVITISVLSNKRGGDPKGISLFYNHFPGTKFEECEGEAV